MVQCNFKLFWRSFIHFILESKTVDQIPTSRLYASEPIAFDSTSVKNGCILFSYLQFENLLFHIIFLIILRKLSSNKSKLGYSQQNLPKPHDSLSLTVKKYEN